MTPRERAEQLWETWKKATFVTSTRTIHAENYIELAEQVITAAIEEEREACAKIAYAEYASIQETTPSGRYAGQGKRECCADRCIVIRDKIRARSTASVHSAAPAETLTDVEAL